MPSKTTAVYDLLKQDVIRLRFRRDEIINEKALAERYQVSKTPVREALSMLVQEGYLKKIPRVGYLVREVTEEDYYKLIYLRFTLEKGVVLRIIRHCTEEEILSLREHCREEQVSYQDFGGVNYDFHMAMAQLTGNEYLAEEVRRIFQWTIRAPSVNLYQEVHEEPHKYHLQLIDAMWERDVEKALQLIEHECRRDDDPDSIF